MTEDGRPMRGQGRKQPAAGWPGKTTARAGTEDQTVQQEEASAEDNQWRTEIRWRKKQIIDASIHTRTDQDIQGQQDVERDRENKNKKKDFEKTPVAGHNRPNQGGREISSRIPKALQKPAPQQKQEEKKPEVKEITLPEKLTIRELAEAMKMQPSAIVKKLFMEGTDGNRKP